MQKVEVKNSEGKKVEDMELSEEVFGVKANENLLHQVYVCQYSNRRAPIAHTKDRSERAGSGRKPWRQKGTGRARVGDVRTPIWRKGGIVFGPSKERNFSKKVTKKMKAKATKMALSAKLAAGGIVVLNDFNLKEQKTKEAGKILDNLKLDKSVLWTFNPEEKENMRVVRNLKNVKNIIVDNLSVFDILNSNYLLLTKDGVNKIEERFSVEGKNRSEEAKAE